MFSLFGICNFECSNNHIKYTAYKARVVFGTYYLRENVCSYYSGFVIPNLQYYPYLPQNMRKLKKHLLLDAISYVYQMVKEYNRLNLSNKITTYLKSTNMGWHIILNNGEKLLQKYIIILSTELLDIRHFLAFKVCYSIIVF